MLKKVIRISLILLLSIYAVTLTFENKKLQKQNEQLRLYSGESNLNGPGVIIRLQDGSTQSSIIHDTDILVIVNELWASQAKAISINGERIIMTTAIRCAGPSILINEKAISSPFVIKALGHSQTLASSLNINSGHISTLKNNGSKVYLSKENKIIIPKYSKNISNIKITEIQ